MTEVSPPPRAPGWDTDEWNSLIRGEEDESKGTALLDKLTGLSYAREST